MENYRSASTVVNDQFTFFSLPSNQDGATCRTSYPKKMKKTQDNKITKLTLSFGWIELLISIISFGGFVGPLKNSPWEVVLLFTLFSIIFGFSGLLSIATCWCGQNISLYFIIIRLIWSTIAIGCVCVEYYVAFSQFLCKEEWKNHIFIFVGLATIEGATSLTSLMVLFRFLMEHTCEPSKNRTGFENQGINEVNVPLAMHYNEDQENGFEPSLGPLQVGNRHNNLLSSSLAPPGTPPPTYNDVRSSLIYERMARNQ